MIEDVKGTLRGSAISWSALAALALAVIAGVYGYGQLSQRVQHLEELQPVIMLSKLAVIEVNQIRTSADISQMREDLSEIRRQILERQRQYNLP